MELPYIDIYRPWLLSCALRCTKCLSIKPQVGPKFQIQANCLRYRTHFRHHPRHLFCSKRWCQLPGDKFRVTAWKKASKDRSQYSHDFPGSWLRNPLTKTYQMMHGIMIPRKGRDGNASLDHLKCYGVADVSRRNVTCLYCTLCSNWWGWTECLPLWILPRGQSAELLDNGIVSFKPCKMQITSDLLCLRILHNTNWIK